MRFEAAQDKKNGILFLSGELTLLQAGQLKIQLLQALASSECLIIDIAALTGIDLACLQLLCSARRSAEILRKQLTLIPQGLEAFTNTVRKAGLLRCHGCDSLGEGACLWDGGER